MTTVFPVAIDELVLQEEDGSEPEIFRRQARDFNALAVKIHKLQEVIGVGSPQVSLLDQIREITQNAHFVLDRGPRTLFMSTGGATTVGADDTDLMSYTMPANTLRRDGDRLLVEAMFDVGITATTTNETRSVRLYFGSDQTACFSVDSGQQRRLFIDIEILRLSATSQRITCRTAAARTTVTAFEANTLTSETASENLASAVVVKFNAGTGEPTHPIVQKYMSVTLYPI